MPVKCERICSSVQSLNAWKIPSRFATPGPMRSKSTAGFESVVARMIFLRITIRRIEQRDRMAGARGGLAHLLVRARPGPSRARRPWGACVAGITNVSP